MLTEAEWLSCQNPQAMLGVLKDARRLSERKLRLVAVACCRCVWDLLSNDASRCSVDCAERYVEAEISARDLYSACLRASHAARSGQGATVEKNWAAAWVSVKDPLNAARSVLQATSAGYLHVNRGMEPHEWHTVPGMNRAEQTSVLREVFSNPFALLPQIDPAHLAWQDETPVKLARSAYDLRSLPSGHLDNGRLAVLADSLEEAGLVNDEVLSHLRSAGPHYRGCWALDLVLGRQ